VNCSSAERVENPIPQVYRPVEKCLPPNNYWGWLAPSLG